MDGRELAIEIKSTPEIADTIMIMMTAYPKEGLERELEKEGFSGYLTKPIHVDLLSKMLHLIYDDHKKGLEREIITQHILEVDDFYKLERNKGTNDQPLNILLVEDNRINRFMAEEMLKKLGCETDTASDGKEAVEKCKNNDYDIVFMDCQMPVMDGYEATGIIKRNNITSSPIIAFTANAMAGDREKCLEAGMDDYITKPIRSEEMKRMIDKWRT